jgi:hypothetical protein
MQFVALALAALSITAAGAADPPLAAAGYSQTDITADNCSVKSPGLTVCYLRPRTMGRYLVHVEGTSTANGPDATQSIGIVGAGGTWACGSAETKKGSWSSGARTLMAECGLTVLSDAPLEIDATFGSQGATLDPGGPVVTIHRTPWNGVLDASSLHVGMKDAAAK